MGKVNRRPKAARAIAEESAVLDFADSAFGAHSYYGSVNPWKPFKLPIADRHSVNMYIFD
jgi:hypothetical protein